MHTEQLSDWVHDHVFDEVSERAERSTRIVMWITAAMMVVEVTAGWWYNSMALLADGLHMASHAAALTINAFAYAYARRHARNAAAGPIGPEGIIGVTEPNAAFMETRLCPCAVA